DTLHAPTALYAQRTLRTRRPQRKHQEIHYVSDLLCVPGVLCVHCAEKPSARVPDACSAADTSAGCRLPGAPLVLLEPVSQVELRTHEVGRVARGAVPLVVEPEHRRRDLQQL